MNRTKDTSMALPLDKVLNYEDDGELLWSAPKPQPPVIDDYDAPVIIECPVCGAEQEDFDGFGVVHCPTCGYCTHPSSQGGVCDICGKVIA